MEAGGCEAIGHAHMIQLEADRLLDACDTRSDGVALGF